MALQFLNSGYFAGLVGIGTTPAVNILTVKAAAATIDIQSTADNQTVGLRAGYLSDGNLAGYFRYTTGDAQLYIDNNYTGNNGVYSDINIRNKTASNVLTTRIKIKGSTGNVGIGNTTPFSKLQVGDPDVQSQTMLTIASMYTATPPALNFRTGHPTAGNNTIWNMAQIRGDDDGSYSGRLEFLTRAATSSGSTTEPIIRMVIDDAGLVKFNNYGAGTLVTDASGNITVSSGGGAGGPYLPLVGGAMSTNADITNIRDLQVNDEVAIGGATIASRKLAIYNSNAANEIEFIGTEYTNIYSQTNSTMALEVTGTGVLRLATTGGNLTIANSGNATFTGNLSVNGSNITLNGAYPRFNMYSTDAGEDDYSIINDNGVFGVYNATEAFFPFRLAETTGNATFSNNLTVSGGTLTLGADVSIFRDGVNIIRTDDQLHANNDIYVGGAGKIFDRANNSNYIEVADTIVVSTALYVGSDITVAGGDITLQGLGRIQGIDTITDPTDAANRAYVDAHDGGAGVYLPLAGGIMTGDIVMQDELLNFKSGGSATLPQFTGLRSSTDLNSRSWTTEGGWAYTTFENSTSNKPSSGLHNANGLLSFNTHGDNYMAQIAMTTNTGKLWHRSRNGGSWLTWYQIYSTQDFSTTDISNWNTAYANMVTAVAVTGTTTKTITLTQQDGGTVSNTFTAGVVQSVTTGNSNTITIGGSTANPVVQASTAAVSASSPNLATGAQIATAISTAIGTIPSGLAFEGSWNANTDSPDLSGLSPDNGQFWIVSVAGNTDLDGITDWEVGDWAIYVDNGAGTDAWQKVDNSSTLGGAGTVNALPLWTGTTSLGTSRFTQTSTRNVITGPGTAGTDLSVNVENSAGQVAIQAQEKLLYLLIIYLLVQVKERILLEFLEQEEV